MFRAAALLLLLASCASYAPPAIVDATYRCDGGVVLPVRFDNRADVAELTLPSGARATLAHQPSGSGIRYASEAIELRGKGREAIITLPGGPPLTCLADE